MPVLIAKVLPASDFNCNSQMVGLAVLHDKEKIILIAEVLPHCRFQFHFTRKWVITRDKWLVWASEVGPGREAAVAQASSSSGRPRPEETRKPPNVLTAELVHGPCSFSASGAPQAGGCLEASGWRKSKLFPWNYFPLGPQRPLCSQPSERPQGELWHLSRGMPSGHRWTALWFRVAVLRAHSHGDRVAEPSQCS